MTSHTTRTRALTSWECLGISRALRALEASLKQTVESKIRAATVKDEDAEGGEGGDDGSRPSTGA